jgi:hypothetical protein
MPLVTKSNGYGRVRQAAFIKEKKRTNIWTEKAHVC